MITESLSDDVLLNVFSHYLYASPHFWPTLTHVCRRWRQIILRSPLGLHLRLFCTHGRPVLKTLDCWPAFPIIVQYGGAPNLCPPATEDDDNIIAALKQSGRVTSISLTATRSLVEKLSAISEPFSDLEELSLLSRDDLQVTLPGTFRWGPRLHTLHSTRIAFVSFPQLLLPSQNLVDLQLHEIPSTGYFPPEAFANALSGMTQLRTLSLHFLSLPPRRRYLSLPSPSGERIVLPALTRLEYRGTSKYLDSFVARIDAPCLGDIDITFFSQPTMDASQLGRFIERIEMQTFLRRAEVRTSAHAISISFTNSSTSTPLQLQISCRQLDWQLSCMTQVCHQFSPFLFRVAELSLNMTESSSGQNEVSGEQWLELIRSFNGARSFRVADQHTTDILGALGRADAGHTAVLPALRYLHVEDSMKMNGQSWDALLLFITSRSVSGRPVQANMALHQCNICHATFREKAGLERHLIDKHGYRGMCSYCADFECGRGFFDNGRFRQHLISKHFEVTRDDPLILKTSVTPSSLYRWHSTLRAPDYRRTLPQP